MLRNIAIIWFLFSLLCQCAYCQITDTNYVRNKYCYRAGGRIHICVKLEDDSTFFILEEETGSELKLNRYFGNWEIRQDTLELKFVKFITYTPKDLKYFDKMTDAEKIVLYVHTDLIPYWTLVKGNKVWNRRKLYWKVR